MPDSRVARDNQILFLVLRFRQRPSNGILVERGETNPTPRKQTGQFLLNPMSPSEPIFHHQRSPTHGHTMANGISSSNMPPQPIQDADPSNLVFIPPAAPPQPQEAPSLAPPKSVDTHMQYQQPGMEVVDPSWSCRNVTGFSKGGDSGEQAQHLELPQEAMVVERTQTPLPDFHVDSIKGYWLNSAVDWCKYYADDSRAVGTGKR
ncbi:hypothetical protein M378DRAFT_172553 [Amanita muscaria Koide BX008]|uniref:Uncharacterized protein n=1 Tax=Amanita muscaria (strain Koide BX008) TaxID=946122 RepID=A0A0C2WKC2_AMAMK|nr:hypothetical protein M378DRAFT_172553 [Amanita muscaria Koide BX008]